MLTELRTETQTPTKTETEASTNASTKAQRQTTEEQFRMIFTVQALRPFVPCLNEAGPKILLHVGAGSPNNRPLPACFQGQEWMEVRVDIDKRVKPNIVASVTDMKGAPDERSHAVFSSHSQEHLNDYEVAQGFSEIYRVLRPGGFLLMNVPDLGQVAQMIIDGKADDVLYESQAGPVRPIDMLFGHQRSIENGNGYMAHRTGFTSDRLERFCLEAGFSDVRVRTGNKWDLWVVAVK